MTEDVLDLFCGARPPEAPGRSLPPLTLSGWLRYDVIEALLGRLDGVERVLEIGVGEGALGARLARKFDYVGLEPDRASFRKANERLEGGTGGKVLEGSVEQLPPAARFDLVCAFEVLEHIEDDSAALSEWRTRLRPDGWMLVSVPAWRARWGLSDQRVGHYRRYDPSDLEELMLATGFAEPRLWLYGFPLGYVLQATWNVLARRSAGQVSSAAGTAGSGRWLQPPDWLAPVTEAISLPFRLLQRPFGRRGLGTGLVCLARYDSSG